ncbi:hypothetical protein PBY51_005313 [Eleginops maclovinus]|uniref:Fork-head domain-containing protein n=1 Tax=Eleginops maclovinus TaxID=56733 RepID=A0AAN7X2V8_ELEMC|nr:hypothetical protein PBY51_005313 [Eleginops maclovinus]
MKNRTAKFEALLRPASCSQRGVFKRSTAYLARIAVILHYAPGKMLTFTRLVERLVPLIPDDIVTVENSIRVCLSNNKCFVRIPVTQNVIKRNHWKLDSNQITAKMAHRHFKGILQLFPELASKVE